MLILPYLLVVLVSFIITWYLRTNKPLRNFPAGPRQLPFLGNLLSVGLNLKDAFNRWRNTYGPIVGFKLGQQPCIVISDFDMLNEAFKDDRFCGRPTNLKDSFHALFQLDENDKSTGGIVFSDGEAWKEQRRFAMKTLKEFGAGKTALQYMIADEVNKLVEDLKNEVGKPVVMKNRTNMAVANTLWEILNGSKADLKDPQMMRVFNSTSKFIEENSVVAPILILPWLRHLPIFKNMFEEARSSPQEMRKVTSKVITDHIDNYDGESERDFIDCYIKKMQGTTDKSSSFYKKTGEANIQRTIMDLFGAGSETTSQILTFAVNYMIRFPEIQKKIHEEIDEVVGSRGVLLEDRPNMPYTDAFIHEVLRHSCVTYTSPHSTSEDVVFHGYNIPAGTSVYANVSWIMNDPAHWDTPEQFNPNRFIDAETGKFRKNERCIPFLIGKRYCLGQQLAQHQIFLFLVGIMQNFVISTPLERPELVNIEPIVGLMQQCPEYEVILSSRQ